MGDQVTLGLPSQRRSAIPCAQCLSHACSLSHPCPFPPTFDMKGFSDRLTLWGVRVIQIVAVGGTWSQMGGAASLPPLLPGPEAGFRSPARRPMHLCLGRRAPQRIGHGDPRPRPAFRSCLAPPTEARTPRKRVVFADTKGLSLTAVHSFGDAVGAGSEKDFCVVVLFQRTMIKVRVTA
ncbi:hypothetical protein CapIbe_021580 [Capra ibex]